MFGLIVIWLIKPPSLMTLMCPRGLDTALTGGDLTLTGAGWVLKGLAFKIVSLPVLYGGTLYSIFLGASVASKSEISPYYPLKPSIDLSCVTLESRISWLLSAVLGLSKPYFLVGVKPSMILSEILSKAFMYEFVGGGVLGTWLPILGLECPRSSLRRLVLRTVT